MKTGTGIPVFPGISVGPALVWRKAEGRQLLGSGSPSVERKRFQDALKTAGDQLSALCEKAKAEAGDAEAAILEVQQLLLEDPDYLDGVTAAIENGVSAAQAALETGEAFAREFDALEDPYMRSRSADIRDMSRRVYDVLCGHGDLCFPPEPFLLVAEDLAPSETVQLPRDRILGFITRQGSSASHTAILARTLNIPSLVQANIDPETLCDGRILAVDGFSGRWYLEPDEKTLEMLRSKQADAANARDALEAYRGRESITRTGKKVLLCANIGCVEDVETAVAGDAEGIGLMRSEFLYLGRDSLPGEEELFEAYRQVARIMGNKPVTIRTLDVGADKQVSYMGLEREENPAMGFCGIRVSLKREAVFRSQLRAIYRASTYGNLKILFPMISALWELKAAKAICAEVRKELKAEGIPVKDVPLGMMVETPAAAILAREFAKEADFFSVGTNDLTQYTLAVDRQNAKLGDVYDPYHPALLALLGHIAGAAADNGIEAAICGELGADPNMQEIFLKMGYAELSMAPSRILESRKRICSSEIE